MQSSNLIEMVATLSREVAQLRKEIRYGSQVYPQRAIIHSVSDPENLGRVRVIMPTTHPHAVSEWIYTLGFSSGRVPEQYIGTAGIAIFLDGNEADGVFMGVVGDQPESSAIRGNPLSIPIIDTRFNTSLPICDNSSQGQMLLFTNTISVDLKVCVRRNVIDNPQGEGEELKEELFAWKSLTHSLELGIGTYGESNEPNTEYGDTRTNKAWAPCSETLEGERRLFSEDRRLPQAEYICRKQHGEKYIWMPSTSMPIYTLINLPTCIEDFMGATVLLDDGMNAEIVVCSRYQARDTMRWVKFKRDPIKPAAEPTLSPEEIMENEEATVAPEATTLDILKGFLGSVGFSASPKSSQSNLLNRIQGAITGGN